MSGLTSPDFITLLSGILQDEYELSFELKNSNEFEVSSSSGSCLGSFRKETIYTCRDGDRVYKAKTRPVWDDIEIIKIDKNIVIEVSGYEVVSYTLKEFENYDEEFVQDLAYLLQLSVDKNIIINTFEFDDGINNLDPEADPSAIVFPDEV